VNKVPEGPLMLSISEPLVSVVTPVYNGESYIAECIESVIAQTYQNWEYIIVNNCSTDRTKDVAQGYAKKDHRIRIYDNEEFVSAIQNHHVAFRQISPESIYCKVVQADDWIFSDCLSRMVQVAETYPSVGIVGAYRLDDIWVNLDGLPFPSTIISGHALCRASLLGGPYVFGSPTSLLLRSSIIREQEIFYDESQFAAHADTAACYEVLKKWDFGFVHQVLTYTRRHNEAASSFARRMNSYLVGHLTLLKKYGPIYLESTEYNQCYHRYTRKYYKFLGKSLFKKKPDEFWIYHKNSLDRLGCSLNSFDIFMVFFYEVTEKYFSAMKKFICTYKHGSEK
jgi:glycosyltransferase involved in cell wall biosynthesis